jgi:hypothetical protein
MRISRYGRLGIPLCLIFLGSACNIPLNWPDDTKEYSSGAGSPVSTEAVIGFPWEKVDLRVADALGYYPASITAGDSISLYFASKSGANVHPMQLDTVRTMYWGVSVQSLRDTSENVIDYRGDSSVAVMELREKGRGVLKPRKAGYLLTPLASIENTHYAPAVFACRGGDCVKVKIISR